VDSLLAAGKRHREKVGRKSDAIKFYQTRKADAAAGRKLSELRNSKVVTLSELIDVQRDTAPAAVVDSSTWYT
jgi:phage terminase Nu1 subunit (DNA packaging protein)